MLDVEPDVVAHDLHPEYLSTKWALEQDAELVGVQHHHAHAAACLAEHGEEGPALALVFDGTGYGTDGTLWGGELLRCDLESFERLAHLDPVPLPGGEAAIREPWRVAALHLERAGLAVPWPEWPLVRESLKLAPPLSSGMGRLFDAVAAVLGVRERVSYEGQAAIELEQLAGTAAAEPYPWRFGDSTGLVATCRSELASGRPPTRSPPRFHETVAAGAADACAGGGRAAPGRALRRQLPEPPAARLDARPARGARLPRPHPPARAAERRRHKLRAGRSRGEEDRLMCLAIPAQIVELVDPEAGLAKAEISGVRRTVSIALCPEAEVGDWVLVHVGFALERIDEEQARETLALLEQMGEAYEQELREIRESAVG